MNIQQQVVQNTTNIGNLEEGMKEMKDNCKEKHGTEYKRGLDWKNTFIALVALSLNVLLFIQKG